MIEILVKTPGINYVSIDEAVNHLRLTGGNYDNNEIATLIDTSCSILTDYLGWDFRLNSYIEYQNTLICGINEKIEDVYYLSAKETYTEITDWEINPSESKKEIIVNKSLSIYLNGFSYKIFKSTNILPSNLDLSLKHCILLILHDLYENRSNFTELKNTTYFAFTNLAFKHAYRVFV